MKYKTIMLLLLVAFGSLQASSRSTPSSDEMDKILGQFESLSVDQEFSDFIKLPAQKAVFAAILQGGDDKFIALLLDSSCEKSPSPSCASKMIKMAESIYRTKSPLVQDLEYQINHSMQLGSVKREELRKRLNAIQYAAN